LILGHETPEILTSDWLILAIQVANQTKPATDRLNALVKHDLTITLHALHQDQILFMSLSKLLISIG